MDYGSGKQADSLPEDKYLSCMNQLMVHSVRCLDDTGSIWVLCPERWADQFGAMLSELLSRRNRIIWRETFGQYHEYRYPSGHRHLFWHVKDPKRSPFYTDNIRVASQHMLSGDKRAAGPRVSAAIRNSTTLAVWSVPATRLPSEEIWERSCRNRFD
ncbi:MAG: DNA methyltransferase [Pirellulales bacterium]